MSTKGAQSPGGRAFAGFAESPWNQKVDARFRDETYLLISGDLVLIGANDDTYGVEVFSTGRLQPTNRRKELRQRGTVGRLLVLNLPSPALRAGTYINQPIAWLRRWVAVRLCKKFAGDIAA